MIGEMEQMFDRIVIIVMAVFSLIGGIDRVFGNRFKLGTAFENGIMTMGNLALSMIGIIVLSPVLADCLGPVIVPFYEMLGADPAMFAGTLLACDMGGGQLAVDLAGSREAAQLGGIITASMLGTTVSFTIPIAMNVPSDEDRKCAAKGILCGVITIPLGIVAGGIVAGFSIIMILQNTVPVILFSLLIALGLWKAERYLIKGFEVFGKVIGALATVGLAAAGVELTTGFTIISGLGSIEEAFVVVGQIAIVLTGAFPLIVVLTKLLDKPIERISKVLRINRTSVSGLVATLANSIATFDMVKDMDVRGKVVNMAFAVSGAFVLGDHLAFAAGFDSAMIPALIAGKLCAGVTAIALAFWISRKEKRNV